MGEGVADGREGVGVGEDLAFEASLSTSEWEETFEGVVGGPEIAEVGDPGFGDAGFFEIHGDHVGGVWAAGTEDDIPVWTCGFWGVGM